MKFGQYYKDLPPWAKGILFVGGATIVTLVGFKVYRKFFPSDAQKSNKQLVNEIDSDIKSAQTGGQTQSFTDSNYATFANTIYNSMRYAVGDDYATVVEILKKMKNDLDVAKLVKAFGFRQDYIFGIDAGSPMDLFTYVRKELGNEFFGITSYRLTQINNDWKAKGIKYTI